MKIYQNLIDIVTKSKKWSAEKNAEKFVEKTCREIIALTELKKNSGARSHDFAGLRRADEKNKSAIPSKK